MNYTMYLDDLRDPKGSFDVIVRSYDEAVKYVEQNGMPYFISFDHDLGLEDIENVEKTGYDFAKWLAVSVLDNKLELPANFDFYVHSANNVGRANIEQFLKNFLNFIRK